MELTSHNNHTLEICYFLKWMSSYVDRRRDYAIITPGPLSEWQGAVLTLLRISPVIQPRCWRDHTHLSASNAHTIAPTYHPSVNQRRGGDVDHPMKGVLCHVIDAGRLRCHTPRATSRTHQVARPSGAGAGRFQTATAMSPPGEGYC